MLKQTKKLFENIAKKEYHFMQRIRIKKYGLGWVAYPPDQLYSHTGPVMIEDYKLGVKVIFVYPTMVLIGEERI